MQSVWPRGLCTSTLILAIARGAAAQGAPPVAGAPVYEPSSSTRALAQGGVQSFKEGRYEEAVTRLTQANAEFPAPQYGIYLGRSLVKLDRLVEARQTFATTAAMSPPAPAPEEFLANFHKAQEIAAQDLEALLQIIPLVKLRIHGPPITSVRVSTSLGAALTTIENAELVIELNPGAQVLHFDSPGFQSATVPLEAATRTPAGPATALAITLRPQAAGVIVIAPPPPDTVSPSPWPLSHRFLLGAFARADIEPIYGGASAALGLSYGLHDFIEPYVAVQLGRDVGFEAGVTGYFTRGALKPMIQLGVPVLSEDRLYPGLRAAAGLQWDLNPHFGAFALLGGAFFFAVPTGYEQLVLIPAIGIQGRL